MILENEGGGGRHTNSTIFRALSCVKDFQNLNSMVTWCINLGRLLALIISQRSSLK